MSWVKRGTKITGEATGDRFGDGKSSISFSTDGSVMAVGAYLNDGNGTNSGSVRVYYWNGSNWIRRGQDIDGEASNDNSGYSTSLSADGSILAIGAILNDGNGVDCGSVRVYYWNGTSWIKKGQDIDGEGAGDWFGVSVSLNANGNTLAIGSYFNDGNGANSGSVRVYNWNGTSWIKQGQDIDGAASNNAFGSSVSISNDGSILAIGARSNNYIAASAGSAKVYYWGGSSWIQRGQDLYGEALNDYYGFEVSLSTDGNTLAVGSVFRDGVNGVDSGSTYVYYWNNSTNTWIQKGQTIDGEAEGDFSGISISLSGDGTILAIGARRNAANGTDSGHIRVYNWVGSSWVKQGIDLDGYAAGDNFGITVSLSKNGRILAGGSQNNYIQIYTAPLSNTTITTTSSYTKILGDASFNLNATSNNTETSITYSSSNTSVVTVDSSGQINIVGTGSSTITLSQATTTNYNSGSATVSITVNKLTLNQCIELGYTLSQLKSYGFTASELKAANYTASELKDVGFTATELKVGGYTAIELKLGEFTADQLKSLYSVDNIAVAGYSIAELTNDVIQTGVIQNQGFTSPTVIDGSSSTITTTTGLTNWTFNYVTENASVINATSLSARLNGSSNNINITDSGTGTFTFECHLYLSSYGIYNSITIFQIGNYNIVGNANFGISIGDGGSGTGKVFLSQRGSWLANSTSTISLNTWHHIAYRRINNAHTVFLNGVIILNTTASVYIGSNSYTILGNPSSSTAFDYNAVGNQIYQARLTLSNVYSGSSFTPPSSDLTDISNTVFLYRAANNSITNLAANSVTNTITDYNVTTSTVNPSFKNSNTIYKVKLLNNLTNSNTDSPFSYDGTSNIALSVNQTTVQTVSATQNINLPNAGSYIFYVWAAPQKQIYHNNQKFNLLIDNSWNLLSNDISFNTGITNQPFVQYKGSFTTETAGNRELQMKWYKSDTTNQSTLMISDIKLYYKMYTLNEIKSYFSANQFKAANYTASDLKAVGFTGIQLYGAGYTATEMKTAGYTASELTALGYTGIQIYGAGYSATEMKTASFTATELKAFGFSATEMKTASYTATELKALGYTGTQLFNASFSATEMKTASYTATELKSLGYTGTQLYSATFTATEMKTASFTATELKALGYTGTQIFEAGYSATEMKVASYTATELKSLGFIGSQLYGASFTATEMKTASYTATELKALGYTGTQLFYASYTATEMKSASYTATELKELGYTGTQLYSASFTATEMKTASFTATELKALGYSATEMKSANYSAVELKNVNYTGQQLFTAGYNSTEMKDANFTASEMCLLGFTVAQLKSASYSNNNIITAGYLAIDLKNEGYTATELKNNYSVTELINAGFTAENVIAAGFTASNLKNAGFTIAQLRIYGYSENSILAAGYSATELRNASPRFTATQLKNNGYTIIQLRTAGYSVIETSAALFTRTEIAQSGYTITDLKNGGLSVTDLRVAGFTPQQLSSIYSISSILQGGFSANALYLAGYSMAQLRSNNYSDASILGGGFPASALFGTYLASQLKPYGYSALDLLNGGYLSSDILVLGYSATELKAANFTATELKSINFSAQQLISGGYLKTEVINLGFSASELKAATFTASELRIGNFTIAQLIGAVFTDNEILAGGYTAKQLKDSGYSASQLQNNNYTIQNMKDAGFSSNEIITAGYNASTLRTNGYTAQQLKNNNYTISNLKLAGYTDDEILIVGYSADELKLNGYTAVNLKNNNYSAYSLKVAGYIDTEILAAGFSATQLKLADYTASQLNSNGYTINDLKVASYSTQSILTAGYSAADLKSQNYTAIQLKQYGYTVANLIDGGYLSSEILSINYSANYLLPYYTVFQLKSNNYTPIQLKSGGFNDSDILSASFSSVLLKRAGYTASQLRTNNYTIADLISANYTNAEILSAGYSSSILRDAGYSASQLRENSYSIQNLIDGGYTNNQILASGFSANLLNEYGYTAAELFANNYTATQLKNANYSDSEIINLGYTIQQLKTAAYLPIDLKDIYSDIDILSAGFNASSLKDSNYTVSQLKENGYSVNNIKSAGYNNSDILSSGFTATELKQNNYSATDLYDNNYTSSELKDAGYSVLDLQNGGYSTEEILFAKYLSSQLRLAGYTSVQLKNGFYSALELKSGGYPDNEVLSIGYSVKELTIAGYSVDEMRSYGYSDGTILTGISNAIETLPNPPTITNITTGNSSVYIYFTDSSNTDIPIIGYKYTLDGGTSQYWSKNNDSPLLILGLTNGTSYNIGIYAVNRNGTSSMSNLYNNIVPSDVSNKPFILNSVSSNGVISFEYIIINDNGSAITEYYYSIDDVNYILTEPSGNKIRIDGLNGNQTYNVSIKTKNAKGFSEKSNTLTIKNIGLMTNPIITDVSYNYNDRTVYINYTIDSSLNNIFYKYSLNDGDYFYFKKQEYPLTLTNLSLNDTYNIKIKSYHYLYGESTESNSVTFTTMAEPSVSTILNANYYNGTITLNIIEGTNNGSPITYYYYSLNDGPFLYVDNMEDSIITIKRNIDTNANNVIIIKSSNAIGMSEESNSAVLVYKILPDKPTINSVTAGDGKCYVNFTDGDTYNSPILCYKYKLLNDTKIYIAKELSNPIVITGLTNGVNNSVKIKTVCQSGESEYSNISESFLPFGVPSPPYIISVEPRINSLLINFEARNNGGSEILGYKYSINGGDLIESTSKTSPILVNGLVNKFNYSVSLFAYNNIGLSSESNISSGIPGVPTAPIINSISTSDSTFSINYTQSAFNNGSAVSKMYYTFNGINLIAFPSITNPLLIKNVTNGKNYDVRIISFNQNGISPFSNIIKNVIVNVPPAKLTIDSVTLFLESSSSVFAVVKIKPPNDNGSPILKYKYALNYSNNYIDIQSTSTPLVIPNLPINASIAIKLKATNLYGDSAESALSKVVKYNLAAPSRIVVKSVTTSFNSMLVNFTRPLSNGSDITTYKYSLNNQPYIDISSNVVPFSVPIQNNTQYNIQVTAVNIFGESIPSAALAKTVSFAYLSPLAPKITSIVGSNNTLTINFTASATRGAPVTTYSYSLDASSTIINTQITSSPLVITGLTNNTSYPIALYANSLAGISTSSNIMSASPIYDVPGTPIITNIIPLNNSCSVILGPQVLNGSPISNYLYSIDGGNTLINTNTSETTILISNLINGTTYNIQVVAVNALGNSLLSLPKSVTPIYSVPSAPVLTGVRSGLGGIVINFRNSLPNGSAIKSYFYSLDNGNTFIDSNLLAGPLLVKNLTSGFTYTVRLYALNDLGNSPMSNAISVVVQ